jgi:hypothetical protein
MPAPVTVAASTRKPAFVQEGLLFRRRRAPQNSVAVRETAEPPDDRGVVFGVFEVVCPARLAEQIDAAELVRKMLRMHEGQVEKLAQIVRDSQI